MASNTGHYAFREYSMVISSWDSVINISHAFDLTRELAHSNLSGFSSNR
jgi:hypothetical protein